MKTLFVLAMIAFAIVWLLMVVLWEAKVGYELQPSLLRAINFLSLALIIFATCQLCKVDFAIVIGTKLSLLSLFEVILGRVLLSSCITGKP